MNKKIILLAAFGMAGVYLARYNRPGAAVEREYRKNVNTGAFATTRDIPLQKPVFLGTVATEKDLAPSAPPAGGYAV